VKTLVQISRKPWDVKFHASSGNTYVLHMVETVKAIAGHSESATKPVALVEDKTGNIKAIYPDPRFRDIFANLEEMGRHYDSVIEGYESVEDMAS
jgi:hypothetical protein